jgi:hypothetical protein
MDSIERFLDKLLAELDHIPAATLDVGDLSNPIVFILQFDG